MHETRHSGAHAGPRSAVDRPDRAHSAGDPHLGFHQTGGFSGDGRPGAADPTDLPHVALSQLPPQAAQTVALIEAGGPFPYSEDGIVLHNYEGLLPAESTGYDHEYTVTTPGAGDRGARRIIEGSGGELYRTDDHYRTFERISP